MHGLAASRSVTDGMSARQSHPEWNDLVSPRRLESRRRATARHQQLPRVTGRLCPAPCEPACVLAINRTRVAIKPDRAVRSSDRRVRRGLGSVRSRRRHRTGQRRRRRRAPGPGRTRRGAAAQPRGPSCHGLRAFGSHRWPAPVRDPRFQDEKWSIDRRIGLLEAEGITFETGYDIGADVSAAQLRERFDAVVLRGRRRPAARRWTCPGGGLARDPFRDGLPVQQNRRVAGERVKAHPRSLRAGAR